MWPALEIIITLEYGSRLGYKANIEKLYIGFLIISWRTEIPYFYGKHKGALVWVTSKVEMPNSQKMQFARLNWLSFLWQYDAGALNSLKGWICCWYLLLLCVCLGLVDYIFIQSHNREKVLIFVQLTESIIMIYTLRNGHLD